MCRNSLASCCAALVYFFTIKRTEVEHAVEREGKHASANGTQRKQNIKFKGKLHLRPAAAAGCTASSAAQCAAYVAVSVVSSQFFVAVSMLSFLLLSHKLNASCV